jgi:diguanylate cyclase (GGDEF)-like protein/PAS domain S-box-containing protein
VSDPTAHQGRRGRRGPLPDPRSPLPGLPGGRSLAALAFDASPVAQAVMSLDGQWVMVNEALCDLLGYPAERLLGAGYQSLTHPDDLESDARATAALFEGDGRGPAVEKRLRHADGHMVWVRISATLVRDDAGEPAGVVAVAEDIGEHRDRHAELFRLALHDPLTGVRNRARLDEDIERALRARDAVGGVVAVLFLDVDDFKDVNDGYGHEVGDAVLVLLTSRLREALRDEDTVARLGGDEFVLVAHLPSAEHAEELRARVEQVLTMPLVLEDRTLPVRVSIGMAVVEAAGRAPADVLAAADASMYLVKRNRKSARPSSRGSAAPVRRGIPT